MLCPLFLLGIMMAMPRGKLARIALGIMEFVLNGGNVPHRITTARGRWLG